MLLAYLREEEKNPTVFMKPGNGKLKEVKLTHSFFTIRGRDILYTPISPCS